MYGPFSHGFYIYVYEPSTENGARCPSPMSVVSIGSTPLQLVERQYRRRAPSTSPAIDRRGERRCAVPLSSRWILVRRYSRHDWSLYIYLFAHRGSPLSVCPGPDSTTQEQVIGLTLPRRVAKGCYVSIQRLPPCGSCRLNSPVQGGRRGALLLEASGIVPCFCSFLQIGVYFPLNRARAPATFILPRL